jgi:Xaa-Pro aminopeptidase
VVTDAAQQEFAARLERARAAMAEEGMEGLLVADDTASHLSGHTRYLSNLGIPGAAPGGRQSVVVVPADGDPIHVVPPGFLGCVFELAKSRSVIAEVRASTDDWSSPYEPRFSDGAIQAIKDAGLESARIGVAGGYPGIEQVFAALPGATFSSTGDPDLIWRLRAVKSAWELERLVKAREIAEVGARAFAEAARAGTSSHKAISEAKHVATREGAEEVSVYTGGGTNPWFFGEDGGPDRLFEAGDLWSYEINTRFDGYCCQYPGCFAVGRSAPDDRAVDVATQAYEAMRAAAAPGVTGNELWKIGSEISASAGLRAWGQFGHGVGMSLEPYPRVWPGNQIKLQNGSCFVLHPAVVDPNGGAPAMIGDELTIQGGTARLLVESGNAAS